MVDWTMAIVRDNTHENICQGLAGELEEQGYYVRRFANLSMFQIMDKPWNAALCFHVGVQNDGFLIADHMSYSEDVKQTTLIPYDVPDMLDIIIKLIGKCPHME